MFDVLQKLGLDGHGLYEYRYRKEGKQVDYPFWLHSMARFAVQVKGGHYEMDNTDKWFLRMPDGRLERVHSSPLEENCRRMHGDAGRHSGGNRLQELHGRNADIPGYAAQRRIGAHGPGAAMVMMAPAPWNSRCRCSPSIQRTDPGRGSSGRHRWRLARMAAGKPHPGWVVT